MNNSVKNQAFASVMELNRFTLPKQYEYFFTPDDQGKIRFLSIHAIELFLQNIKQENVATLAKLGLSWQAAKHIVRQYCLMRQPNSLTTVPDAWDYKRWELHRNPAPGQGLSSEHQVSAEGQTGRAEQAGWPHSPCTVRQVSTGRQDRQSSGEVCVL